MNCISRYGLKIFRADLTGQNHFSILQRALAYKSAFSLDKLYPTSNIKIYTPTFVPEDPNAKFNGYIPLNQLDITYSRSTGAGGQHVNCVNTKVDLRFNVKGAKWLADEIKEKLSEQYKNKINKEGYLIIKSELTRSQQLNLANALDKLRNMIWEVLQPPPEISAESLEKKRKNLLRAARERISIKKAHSQKKRDRQGPSFH